MKLTLIEKKEISQDTFSFIFESDPVFTWKAGQFLRYQIEDPSPDERKNHRFFTISSSPSEKIIMLTTKFVPGDGSSFKKDLQNLKVGDKLNAFGPGGDFIIEDYEKNYVFIAGGIGITPFRSILTDLSLNQKPINVKLLYANRTDDFPFKSELEAIKAKNPSFEIHYFVDPQRIDEKSVRSLVSNLQIPIFYVSGPEPMVETIEKMLYQIGVPKEHVKRDYFPGYEWP